MVEGGNLVINIAVCFCTLGGLFAFLFVVDVGSSCFRFLASSRAKTAATGAYIDSIKSSVYRLGEGA